MAAGSTVTCATRAVGSVVGTATLVDTTAAVFVVAGDWVCAGVWSGAGVAIEATAFAGTSAVVVSDFASAAAVLDFFVVDGCFCGGTVAATSTTGASTSTSRGSASVGVLPVEPVLLCALTTTPPMAVFVVEPVEPVNPVVADPSGFVDSTSGSVAGPVVDSGPAAAGASDFAGVEVFEPLVEAEIDASEVDASEVDALEVEVPLDPVDGASAAAMP